MNIPIMKPTTAPIGPPTANPIRAKARPAAPAHLEPSGSQLLGGGSPFAFAAKTTGVGTTLTGTGAGLSSPIRGRVRSSAEETGTALL